MQIGSVSCVNFKGSAPLGSKENPIDVPYEVEVEDSSGDEFVQSDDDDEIPEEEVETDRDPQETIDKIKRFKEKYGDKAPKLKGPLQIAASLAFAAIMGSLLVKKGYKAINKTLEPVKNSKIYQESSKKISEAFSSSELMEKMSNTKLGQAFKDASKTPKGLEKLKETIASFIGAVIGLIGGATTDSNNNGTADALEKNVSYATGLLKDAVEITEALT